MSTDEGAIVPTTWDEVFKHPRFKQLVDEKKAAETALANAQTQHQTELTGLKQQLTDLQAGESDELTKLKAQIESLNTNFQTAEQARQAAEKTALRLKVANELKIPGWADDLRGDDEAALKAHAESILERINAQMQGSTPGVPPRGGGKPAPEATPEQMSNPAWVRENAAKLWPK